VRASPYPVAVSRFPIQEDKVSKKAVATDKAPEAIGPYNQAVIGGGLVFCSGQIPLDPATGELVQGTITEETRRSLDNLTAVLEAAGTGWENVVKTTCYVTDMADFVEFNEAYAAYVGGVPPARATVGVSALPKGARVEVECIATV
jgi:2-iminobutanoate/2-iminopropanoate deaminase